MCKYETTVIKHSNTLILSWGGDCATGKNVKHKYTVTFILAISVSRNMKLNILSTCTVKNLFMETKSNRRSKDWRPEME